MLSLRLSPHLERAVLAGHPWVYRNQVPQDFGTNTPQWVRLQASKLQAYALWDPDSALALRVYSREQLPDAAWVVQRVQEAWQLRELWRDPARTDAFRWLNGEGDQLPGIVADYYAGYVVLSLASPACELVVPWVVQALQAVTRLNGIVLRASSRKLAAQKVSQRRQGSEVGASSLTVLFGKVPSPDLTVLENGLRFRADLENGQKTGLFLDQRQNRALVETLSRDRDVLNLFAYSGGFSLYAARGAARRVTSVDLSAPALEDARANFALNGFDPTAHRFEAQDVFGFLERARGERQHYDLVICDPPSFGTQNAQVDRALQAYERLFAAALKVTAKGGLFVASSCTARVTVAHLQGALANAAKRARKQVQIIADSAHAPDHPIAVGHPEGRYLKFLLGRVEARC